MSSLSTEKHENLTIEEIISKVRSYIEDEEQIKVIEKAYDFAKFSLILSKDTIVSLIEYPIIASTAAINIELTSNLNIANKLNMIATSCSKAITPPTA